MAARQFTPKGATARPSWEGKDPKDMTLEELREYTLQLRTQLDASTDLGILRTNKGALMVRVSGTRWPIAMYRKDWEILLGKIPAIRAALDDPELNILDENPTPSERQVKQQTAEAIASKAA